MMIMMVIASGLAIKGQMNAKYRRLASEQYWMPNKESWIGISRRQMYRNRVCIFSTHSKVYCQFSPMEKLSRLIKMPMLVTAWAVSLEMTVPTQLIGWLIEPTINLIWEESKHCGTQPRTRSILEKSTLLLWRHGISTCSGKTSFMVASFSEPSHLVSISKMQTLSFKRHKSMINQ